MGVKLLTFGELKEHGVPLGRRQIDRLEARGRFPKRVQIGTPVSAGSNRRSTPM